MSIPCPSCGGTDYYCAEDINDLRDALQETREYAADLERRIDELQDALARAGGEPR